MATIRLRRIRGGDRFMYKSSLLGLFGILGRCGLLVLVLLIAFLGLYEVHYASQQDSEADAELRRLALYGLLLRVNR
ncbi:MAG: hypothetical protein AAGE59_27350 [Cyanobacteria bacterium P01_F01_bin.86]